jgi:uncharacterized phage protein (TIGR01671 family)
MREVKFRAWDGKRLLMIGSDYPKNWGTEKDEWYADIHMMDLTGIENISKDYPRFSVMQFTGLKDKNGKEIYEGDILSSEYPGPESQNCHPVEWSQGRFIVNHNITDCCKAWRGDLSGHHISEEVIGNIYENPELLKNVKT